MNSKPKDKSENETFFGYKKVSSSDKHSLVQNVFTSVASKYDLMNNMMSLGTHHLWKREMLKLIPSSVRLLDVAGGTGDISRLYYNRERTRNQNPEIVICDFNENMLKEGRAKFIDNGILSGVTFICGDALELPFDDDSFDCYTIAFGIRNVVDIATALKEAYRVLKPGGKFVCLEFSKIQNPFLAGIYDLYSFKVIPALGEFVAGDRDSYQYLVESIRKFPAQNEFLRMINQAGFKNSSYKNLNFGITAIHYGYK